MTKSQIHQRLSNEHVRFILGQYSAGEIKAKMAIQKLGVGRTRFYQLVHQYRDDPANFDIKYQRQKSTRKIAPEIEENIFNELEIEKTKIINRKDVPTNRYNYSYIKGLLKDEHNQKVSVNTIIDRAKNNGYYLGKQSKKIHDRVVLTDYIGELIQHDTSPHLFAPDGGVKWNLITSIDDHSRLLLFADLWEHESSFKHILALQSAILNYGIPFAYYTDQHSIFRYVKSRDVISSWVHYTKFTDDVITQWGRVLEELKIELKYALSPQAKGKVERPYQWMQDHLVRTCVREGITKIDDGREILKQEVRKYNFKWVHSTTKEIPMVRFEKAKRENKSLFREFKVEPPHKSVKDIFCLRDTRIVDAYRKVHFKNAVLNVPEITPGQKVDLKVYPDPMTGITEIRIWCNDEFICSRKINKIII